MSTNRWDPLRYQSAIPWGHAPVPLIPSALRAIFGLESAPLPEKVLQDFHLCVRDLDGSFWARNVLLSESDLNEILRWVESKLTVVASADLLNQSMSKKVEISSLALPSDQLRILSETIGQNYIQGADVRFEKLLRRLDFHSSSLAKLACLLECAQPNPVDAFFSSRRSAFSLRDSLDIRESVRSSGSATVADTIQAPGGRTDHPSRREVEPWEIKNALQNLYDTVYDNRIFELLYERTISLETKQPLTELASKFGITYERTRQLEAEGRSIMYRARTRKFLPLRIRAQELNKELGVVVPAYSPRFQREVALAVGDINEPELNKFARHVLVWLAGPYTKQRDWLVCDRKIATRTPVELAAVADEQKYITNENVTKVLTELQIHTDFHEDWMKSFAEFVLVKEGEGKGGYLHCSGEFLDRIENLLKYFNRPFSIEEIIGMLGQRNTRGIRFRMLNDKRFWRINKQADFVLADTPGYRQYTGITNEIEREISVSNGTATVEQIVENLSNEFRVTPNSVLAYVKTPYFRIDPETRVVAKNDHDVIDVETNLPLAGRCFFVDGRWLWRITVNADWLRGSGRTCPDGFAKVLGCNPGHRIRVPTEYGDLAVGWKLDSPSGAHLGSLKKVINSLNLEIGDHLFVGIKDGHVDFRALFDKEISDCPHAFGKLAISVGFQNLAEIESQNWDLIGKSLGIEEHPATREQVVDQLNKRGDRDLAKLVDVFEDAI